MFPRLLFPLLAFPALLWPASVLVAPDPPVPPPADRVLLQARAGLARSGNVRSNYFVYNVVVLINGVDRTADVRVPGGIAITKAVNNQPNTATITLRPTTYLPLALQSVQITLGAADNADVEFAGQILRVTRTYLPDGQQGTRRFLQLECIDAIRLFNRRLVTHRWQNVSATQIACDVVDGWTTGFTRRSVAPNLPIITDFEAIDEPPMALLNRLINLFGGVCFLKAYDLHLYSGAGDPSPTAGTPPIPLTLDLETARATGFTVEEDAAGLTTRVVEDGQRTSCPIGTPDGTPTAITKGGPVEFLVVGGGGAGGAGSVGGGGGGAGRVLTGTFTMPVLSGAVITVGGGGASVAAPGQASAFGGFVAPGGGGGGGSVVPGHSDGSPGGSGGGGNSRSGTSPFAPYPGGAAVLGEVVPGQGNPGGAGENVGNASGGGGGGAGGAGANASAHVGGPGGPGVLSAISGTPTYYGGGGGGNGASGSGAGGLGGGGTGGAGGSPSSAGAPNTGGGGGGSADNVAGRMAGGSGVVILRYLTGTVTATGGTITTAGGYTIHTFTASGLFSLITVIVITDIPRVTDLPLDDVTQIVDAAGVVRVGTQLVAYTGTIGPRLARGANPPGSTLTSNRSVGVTSLPVADITPFVDSHGWVKVDDQIVRYDSKSASALQDIPAVGFGSIAATLQSGASVTALGAIQFADDTIFSPALDPGVEVVQRITVDDAAAAAAVAAREGGDGVHETKGGDSGLTVAGATASGSAELANFSHPLITAGPWETEDLGAEPGRPQTLTVEDESGSYTVALVLTSVALSFPIPNRRPLRTCQAASVQVAALLDAVVTK